MEQPTSSGAGASESAIGPRNEWARQGDRGDGSLDHAQRPLHRLATLCFNLGVYQLPTFLRVVLNDFSPLLSEIIYVVSVVAEPLRSDVEGQANPG